MKNILKIKKGNNYTLYYCNGCNSLLLQQTITKKIVCGCDFKQKLKFNTDPIVYIMNAALDDGGSVVKIGITDNNVLHKRLSKINNASGLGFDVYKIFHYRTRQSALSIEKFLKIKYKELMLDKKTKMYGVTEMYFIDAEIVDNYIQHLNSTFSEYL